LNQMLPSLTNESEEKAQKEVKLAYKGKD